MPAKRCPLCHQASESTAWRCKCGYEFGQSIEHVRKLLYAQRTNARIALAIVLTLDAAVIGGVVYSVMHGYLMFSMLGFIMLGLWTARVVHKLAVTRVSLRQLAPRDLPKAIIHEPDR